MGFCPPTQNPCVMMRQNLKTKACQYIIIYQGDLYIASTTPEEICHILQDKYKIITYLEGKYPHDPSGTMICQLRKYLEELYVIVNILLNNQLPTDLQISFGIIKSLITKGNLNF